ncbi:hypothetical protein [Conexivisphaera calida]|uniref:hypothetical protein n=1 Tax=Conexivisphaera calida TaxID=1874277 RepID=UPI00157B56D5|nr:hypothetical protein [Conexivisphaera calida]
MKLDPGTVSLGDVARSTRSSPYILAADHPAIAAAMMIGVLMTTNALVADAGGRIVGEVGSSDLMQLVVEARRSGGVCGGPST